MHWQDPVQMICGFMFAIVLIPSIRSKLKPAKSSCLMTAILLTVLVFTFSTLGLWLTALSEVVSASVWWMLYFQQIRKVK